MTIAPAWPVTAAEALLADGRVVRLRTLRPEDRDAVPALHAWACTKADVSGNDLLLDWADDPRIAVIALYLESIGNPRRFRRIAREVSRTRPVVTLRNGRSAPGARSGRSHTAAAPNAVLDALLADCGVIRVGLVMVAEGGVHQAVLDDRVVRTIPLGRQVPDQMLAEHCPQIAELDLNPLRVGTGGAVDDAVCCGQPPADWTDPVADEAARAL